MSNNDYTKVKKILWIILFLNLAVAIAKIIYGNIIKSASLSADGFHSLTDGTSNIIALIGIGFASKPIDANHPYGHKKYEMLASFFIAVILFLIGCKVIYGAVMRFIHPLIPEITLESLVVLAITLCINILVYRWEWKEGGKLNSIILISDSAHTKSDILISIGVLLALISITLGLPPIIDPVISLIVACFILYSSYEIFKDNTDILVDTAVFEEETLKELVLSFPKVKDAHNIRSRGNADKMYVDLHVLTEPDLSVQESHKLIHEIEKEMCRKLNKEIELNIHLEPYFKERGQLSAE